MSFYSSRFVVILLVLLVTSSIGMCVFSYSNTMDMNAMHEMGISNEHIDHALSLMQATIPIFFLLAFVAPFIIFTVLPPTLLLLVSLIFCGLTYESHFLRWRTLIQIFFNLRSPPVIYQ